MAIPFFHAFRSTNRGRGPKYTVPARKGGPEGPAGKVKTQSDEGRRRTFLARPFMPMGEQGKALAPAVRWGGMVGQRRPGMFTRCVYKLVCITVHFAARYAHETQEIQWRQTLPVGLSRRRQGFKSPWGRQQEITPLREIVRAFFIMGQICPTICPTHFEKILPL